MARLHYNKLYLTLVVGNINVSSFQLFTNNKYDVKNVHLYTFIYDDIETFYS